MTFIFNSNATLICYVLIDEIKCMQTNISAVRQNNHTIKYLIAIGNNTSFLQNFCLPVNFQVINFKT